LLAEKDTLTQQMAEKDTLIQEMAEKNQTLQNNLSEKEEREVFQRTAGPVFGKGYPGPTDGRRYPDHQEKCL
uniref:hypothetical protein n=1 Tax=Halostella sp. PRR32 TaxID=3098147 RepID=UPI002B1E8E25